LPETTRQMPVRQERRLMTLQREHQRIKDNFKQASGLLRHDLVWDADFESIRADLAEYLDSRSEAGVANHASLITLVNKLIASENDMTI
jgi:hypothetical protein